MADESPIDETTDENTGGSRGFVVNDHRFWTLDQGELDAAAETARAPSYILQLEEQLQQKETQLKDYIAAYKQEVVEGLQKTKERLERDAATRIDRLRGQMAEPMMDVLDALERSIAAAETRSTFEGLLQGVRQVQLLMVQKLQMLGLERIETVGSPFDPSCHEAVTVAAVTDPGQDNIVLRELRPGFTLGGRLVRAAQVQVGKLG